MGSSDRPRRKSSHVRPTLGRGPGRGSGTAEGSGAGSGSGAVSAAPPGSGPGPAPRHKFIEIEIDDVNEAKAKSVTLETEVQFLYRPSAITVVWRHDPLGNVALRHEGVVREHHPPTATITHLLTARGRLMAKFRART